MAEEMRKAIEDVLAIDSVDELKNALPEVMAKSNEYGVDKIVTEMPDLMPKIMKKMNGVDPTEFLDDLDNIVPLFFAGFSSLAESNEDIQEALENIDDTVVNYRATIDESRVIETYIEVKDGKLLGGTGNRDDADFTIEMSMETMLAFSSGEADMVGDFMSGKIKIDGNMAKAMAMMPLTEALDEMFSS